MKTFLEKYCGANFRTTLTGIGAALFGFLTMLAAVPYELGDLALVIPPAWKAKVVTVGLIGAFGLRLLNSVAQKSKEVTGGTVPQTSDGSVKPKRTRRVRKGDTPPNG